ncbi:MAG: YciI family protein [Acidobacteria bacterium]|nr:YciI family protein [Acidobacteriota bacterium]
MMIYTRETGEPVPPERDHDSRENHFAFIDETTRRGILLGVEPLAPTASATTVRTQNGKVLITDGPFAETKEQLAGFYILECKDLDEALDWAAKIPSGCRGGEGCIEVRPLPGLPSRNG